MKTRWPIAHFANVSWWEISELVNILSTYAVSERSLPTDMTAWALAPLKRNTSPGETCKSNRLIATIVQNVVRLVLHVLLKNHRGSAFSSADPIQVATVNIMIVGRSGPVGATTCTSHSQHRHASHAHAHSHDLHFKHQVSLSLLSSFSPPLKHTHIDAHTRE
jgi:hypothetical protein